MWLDAHNHLHDSRLGLRDDAMVGCLRAAGVDGVVANGTCPDDWPQVAALAARFPGFVRPAFGLHPWHAASAKAGWQNLLSGFFTAHPDAAAGEIGLDRWIENPDMDIQKSVFRWQWEQAVAAGRAITVHCLKAWDDLFSLWPDLPPHPGRVLIHGFTGGPELARALVARGCLLGFGGHALQPRKAAARAAFAAMPLENLLLETDAPDMAAPEAMRTHFPGDRKLNHPANLAMHGLALAGLRGLEPQALAAVLQANTGRWLGDNSDCRKPMDPPT